jgi:hypothetical protein
VAVLEIDREDELRSMSVSRLKAILDQRRISYLGVTEKSELIQLIRESDHSPPRATTATATRCESPEAVDPVDEGTPAVAADVRPPMAAYFDRLIDDDEGIGGHGTGSPPIGESVPHRPSPAVAPDAAEATRAPTIRAHARAQELPLPLSDRLIQCGVAIGDLEGSTGACRDAALAAREQEGARARADQRARVVCRAAGAAAARFAAVRR